MRRIIKIFLASSIVEFANERMAIENFIRNVSDNFEENYDVKIQPLLCENFDDAYSKTRKQEEYNEKIRDSELCFFIFFTKAGEYTREEFEVASKKFEETGKPKIYTYFKVIKDEKAEQSLYDFMNELDKTFGHYYGMFDHIDTVKLRILLSLKFQEMDFLEIKTEDGKCIIDDKTIMSLENVSEFSNNRNLEELKKELQQTEEEYYRLKPIYSKGNYDREFCDYYGKIASKRKNLTSSIDELQKSIFEISLRMSSDKIHGEVTIRQKEAYRLFELGDYEGCLSVLDHDEIMNDFAKEEKKHESAIVEAAKKCIKEQRLAINILDANPQNPNRIEEITKRYETIYELIAKYVVCPEILIDYAEFLQCHGNVKASYDVAKHCESIIEQTNERLPELYNRLSLICDEYPEKFHEEEKYLIKAIENYLPTQPKIELATYYYNLGAYHREFHAPDHKDAMFEGYTKCSKVLNEIKDNLNSVSDKARYASLLSKISHFIVSEYVLEYPYEEEKAYKTAVEKMLIAIELIEDVYKSSDEHKSALCAVYKSAAWIYWEQKNYATSISYSEKAKQIMEESIIEDPQYYMPIYISMLADLSEHYAEAEMYEQASAYAEKCIATLEIHRYDYDLGLSEKYAYCLLWCGHLYMSEHESIDVKKWKRKSIDYFYRALVEYQALNQNCPQKFSVYVYMIYIHLAAIYKKQKNYIKYLIYYQKAGRFNKERNKDNTK